MSCFQRAVTRRWRVFPATCAFGKDAHGLFDRKFAQIFVAGRSSGRLCQRGAIVPRHPACWLRGQLSCVLLQLGQVVEGVHPAQLAGVDQAHEQIADLRPVYRSIK